MSLSIAYTRAGVGIEALIYEGEESINQQSNSKRQLCPFQ